MRRGSVEDREEHLVVVVPGIVGSVLESPTGKVLWKASGSAVKHLLWQPERLARDEAARPVGLIENCTLLPGFTVKYGYQQLLQRIAETLGAGTEIDRGHPDAQNLDAQVVAFPYDFRQSIVKSAEELDRQIDKRLAHLGWKNQPNKVIIIAHSMGGLIARYWVAQENWNLCRAVFTLGTPHRGAPKALEYLVNGPPWWVPGRHKLLRELFRDWPAVYELVPRYQSVEDKSAQISDAAGTPKLYPKDLPLPGLQDKLAAAFRTHRDIEDAWKRNFTETDCVAYIGRGHGTLLRASWDGKRLVTDRERPSWLQMGFEERGDGTVPELSACPIEQGNRVERKFLTERHSRMVTADECISALACVIHRMPVPNGDAREDQSLMIGLCLEDSYLLDHPIEVQARPTPRRLVSPRLSLTFELTCDGGVIRTGPLHRRDGGVWSTTFTGLAAGVYEVTVHAVPRDIYHLSNSECFFVLDEQQQ